jgi:hypothetical protein
VVFVTAKSRESDALRPDHQIEQIASGIPGVKEVKVHLRWFTPFGIG